MTLNPERDDNSCFQDAEKSIRSSSHPTHSSAQSASSPRRYQLTTYARVKSGGLTSSRSRCFHSLRFASQPRVNALRPVRSKSPRDLTLGTLIAYHLVSNTVRVTPRVTFMV